MMDLQREKQLSYLVHRPRPGGGGADRHRIGVMYLAGWSNRRREDAVCPPTASLHAGIAAAATPVPDLEMSAVRRWSQGDGAERRSTAARLRLSSALPVRRDRCRQEVPVLKEIAPGHGVSFLPPGEPLSRRNLAPRPSARIRR